MNLKNVIATGLIATTLFGATTAHAQTSRFNDIPSNHWSEQAINYLADRGIVSGYGNGVYGFGDDITRGQVASIMARYYNLKENEAQTTNFSDIKGHMFEESIKAVTEVGIMIGNGTDKFRPDDTLTRYEMAKILQTAFNLEIKGNVPFNDIPSNHWAEDAIKALYSNGVTSGIGNNQYGGQYDVKREQFAKFLYNSIFKGQNPEENHDVRGELKREAESLGFFLNKNRYTYNLLGANGDSVFNVMDLYINDRDEWEAKLYIYSEDSGVEKSVKQFLNILTPTKSEEMWKLINSKGPYYQDFEMDGRRIIIKKDSVISVLFGYKD
ncbi:S-layer homology domain-containing protein [Bacillus mycoides]|nr:S-layer homology domain-containing protein [Bacillus mycoides]